MKQIRTIALCCMVFVSLAIRGEEHDTSAIKVSDVHSSEFSYEISEMKYEYQLTHNEKSGRYGSDGVFSFRIKASGVDYLIVQKSTPYSTIIPIHWSTKKSFDEPNDDGNYDVTYSRDKVTYGMRFQVVFFVTGAEEGHTPLSDIYCCDDFISEEHLALIKESCKSSVDGEIVTVPTFEIRGNSIVWGANASKVKSIKLFSITGANVLQIENMTIEVGQIIPLPQYAKGMYILQVDLGDSSITNKILL